MLVLTQGGGASFLLRMDFFKSSLKAFYENPILGLGIGGFSIYYSGIDRRLYPHNMILEVGSELGILGLASYFFLVTFGLSYLLSFYKNYEKEKKYSYLLIMVLSVFVFSFLNTMISGDINNNRLFFAWIGVIYSVGRIIKKETK